MSIYFMHTLCKQPQNTHLRAWHSVARMTTASLPIVAGAHPIRIPAAGMLDTQHLFVSGARLVYDIVLYILYSSIYVTCVECALKWHTFLPILPAPPHNRRRRRRRIEDRIIKDDHNAQNSNYQTFTNKLLYQNHIMLYMTNYIVHTSI